MPTEEIYYYVLIIRTADWADGVRLAIFDHEPDDAEQRLIIREYWYQYERGLYEKFDEFQDKLFEDGKSAIHPYKLGTWTEKVVFRRKG